MLSKNETGANCANSAPAKYQPKRGRIVPRSEPERNEFTDVATAFACRGHDLVRIDDVPPRYYVSRHGQIYLVHSWLAVKTLLAHIGRAV